MNTEPFPAAEEIVVVQFLWPHARKIPCATQVTPEARAKWDQLIQLGYRVTAEVLPTNQVNVCIESADPFEGDVRSLHYGPHGHGR
jgi:hypothetical protein